MALRKGHQNYSAMWWIAKRSLQGALKMPLAARAFREVNQRADHAPAAARGRYCKRGKMP